ncbi:uncharacterized protein H6S33_004631 [Morchella sextelata]|uniref:uncharacterized protein n=1 Tax=Morchella sextelata TaxID=1174677 RepID=UPI001D045B9E|nr:uncharacterized protein H6S33_004631 [Morchella sextelata]KAH0605409.1 hypothetical protein H6S33_004631 [Morchella sextelata]
MSAPTPLPPTATTFLTPYLPHPTGGHYPFTTLTYAVSLDSHLSLSPGTQTHLSGPLSKSLTHHLRTHHAALLIGLTTALSDDPGLNSRIPGTPLSAQPTPIILDPRFRWTPTATTRVIRTAASGAGKPPYVLVRADAPEHADKTAVIEGVGGRVFRVPVPPGGAERWEWDVLLRFIRRECGVESVMVEGGGEVVNALLEARNQKLVDSVVVTVAPVYLGRGGVNVSPLGRIGSEGRRVPAARFRDVAWCVLGDDVVMAARPDVEI